MKAIGGYGGIKVSGTVNCEVVSVCFTRREAYCSQGVPMPEMEQIAMRNGTTVQRLKGYRIEWTGYFEARTINQAKLDTLEQIIRTSQVNGTDITLTPQWNDKVPDSAEYAVKVKAEGWQPEDISERKEIAQKLAGIVFQSSEWATEIDDFTEGRYIPVLSTIDGKAITFEGVCLEIIETRRK